MCWVNQLKHKRGSRPRCVLLADGDREKTARRLTELAGIPGVEVSMEDRWMPFGRPVPVPGGGWVMAPAEEARLDQPNPLIGEDIRRVLRRWWLAIPDNANTPNWDFASSCSIFGRLGLMLVEAKAHFNEFDLGGKSLPDTANGWRNHIRIGRAIADASAGLQAATGRLWAISRDRHYQASNRFAFGWKLASLGIPVVLVWLGFLDAGEMSDRGPVIPSLDAWREGVRRYCKGLVDDLVWEEPISVGGIPSIPVIRVSGQTLG
jgi:hypothetical protein